MTMDDPRHLLTALFSAAVAAADPLACLAPHLPPRPRGRTVVIGAGKGAAQLAAALETLWDGPLEGVIVTRYGYGCALRQLRLLEAAHPVPDKAGLAAAEQLKAAIAPLTPDDLVIALISGGGSALLPAPPAGLTLADDIAINEALLASGAPISAMNTVRKHLSTIKGGRLAALTRAPVVSLVVSDIPGDSAAQVASGPTIADPTRREDALALVEAYRLRLPDAALAHLATPAADAPHPDDPVFSRHRHVVIASAAVSLTAAAEAAKARGVPAVILSSAIEGEARDVASMHAAIAREILQTNRPFARPVVLLSGGETTVTLGDAGSRGGRGGRNGEFALAMALALDGLEDIPQVPMGQVATGHVAKGQAVEVLAADTDGIDGSQTNAGAFANTTTVRRLRRLGLDARRLLADHDSYSAFAALGDLFETGPTGTNVNDFRAVLIR